MEDERPHDYIDFRIENTVASLEMDGRYITDEDKELIRRVIRGELTFNEAMEIALKEYGITENKED